MLALALARTPHEAYATLERGAIASVRGQRAAALKLLERAVRLDPHDQRAKQEALDGKTANFGRGGEALVPLEDPLKKAQV